MDQNKIGNESELIESDTLWVKDWEYEAFALFYLPFDLSRGAWFNS